MTPKLVLVVDDDEDIRESICDAFAILGHGAVGAADGRAPLELLRTRRFDLIVTDLQMPGMDGLGIVVGARSERRVEVDSCLRRLCGAQGAGASNPLPPEAI